ncbi:MAG TPA: YIP1 family protein [Anaeromyxobacteraceae bacterium]|nr:YIP1 family protein [Anaeromyxobacteraceae bacterium]
MLARCAHCQRTFSTERYGVQTCPHCGWELLLPDPSATTPQDVAPQPSPAQEGAPGPAPTGGASESAHPAAPPHAAATPPPWSSPTPPPWTDPRGSWPPPPGWTPMPAPVPPPEQGESAPFAQRRRLGLFAAYSQTWRLVAFEPTRFFRAVKTSESGSALLFGIVSFTLGTWVSLLFGWMAGRAGTSAMQRLLERLPMQNVDPSLVAHMMERATLGGVIGQALITPLAGLVAIYLLAAVAHVLLLAVRGAPRGFTTTLTAVSYAYGLFLLEALPMCGGLVAVFWFLVVAITGLGEAQRCGSGKAAFAVMGPALIACLLMCACTGWAVFAAKIPGAIDFGKSGEGTGL